MCDFDYLELARNSLTREDLADFTAACDKIWHTRLIESCKEGSPNSHKHTSLFTLYEVGDYQQAYNNYNR